MVEDKIPYGNEGNREFNPINDDYRQISLDLKPLHYAKELAILKFGSLRKFSGSLGYSHAYLSMIFSGKKIPPSHLREKIAATLDLPLSRLWDFQGGK